MPQLRVFGATQAMADVADRLEEIPGSRHVMRTVDGESGRCIVTADLVDDAVDAALAGVNRLGVPTEDLALLPLESIGPSAARPPLGTVVWADLLTQASVNARPLSRYSLFMATAGVIAACSVIYEETTLLVGAMAISPGTLPITAAASRLPRISASRSASARCPRPRARCWSSVSTSRCCSSAAAQRSSCNARLRGARRGPSEPKCRTLRVMRNDRAARKSERSGIPRWR